MHITLLSFLYLSNLLLVHFFLLFLLSFWIIENIFWFYFLFFVGLLPISCFGKIRTLKVQRNKNRDDSRFLLRNNSNEKTVEKHLIILIKNPPVLSAKPRRLSFRDKREIKTFSPWNVYGTCFSFPIFKGWVCFFCLMPNIWRIISYMLSSSLIISCRKIR